MEHVAIIGNGISGITAARHIRKMSDKKITVISSETKYFFARTALMYIYMGHMKFDHTKPYEDWFWKKNKIDLVYNHVKHIDPENHLMGFSDGKSMDFDVLIIATGSKSNKFGWPGQDLEGVQGLYSYQDLQLMESNTKEIKSAVIVGGGLIGIEMAEMLKSRNIPVTLLVMEDDYWSNILPKEEARLISRHLREHGIDLRLSTKLQEILGNENGKVKAVLTDKGEKIECPFVGLTVGVFPNIDIVINSGISMARGILVDEHLETSHPDIYAIGDCAEHRNPQPNRKSVEQVWYTGRMMGETVAQTICGNRTPYSPGNWFNSAKFFDIEYQTYGNVWPELKDDEADFYWEHPDGNKCVHIVFKKSNDQVLGINSFGIRMRHETWDQWLDEKRDINYVMRNLSKANFDPEFFANYESGIINAFYQKYPEKASVMISV